MKMVRWTTLGPAFGLLLTVAAGCGSNVSGNGDTSATDGEGTNGTNGATGANGANGSANDPVFTAPPSTTDGDLDALLGTGCASAEADTTRTPVYMDIVLDASGSMDGRQNEGFLDGSREKDPLAPKRSTMVCDSYDDALDVCPANEGLTGKKWIAVRGALNAYFDSVAATPSDGSLGVSLVRFSGAGATGVRTALKVVDKAQAKAMKDRYNPEVWPEGGTPLDTYVTSELAFLKGFTPAAPLKTGGKRVLVLMTDGVPTPGNGETRAEKQDNIVAAVASAAAAKGNEKITTFAVGIGNPTDSAMTYDATFMSKVGKAGGASAAGCDAAWSGGASAPCHLQVTPGTKSAAVLQKEFSAAIDKIAGTVASCEFAIQRQAGVAFDPALINVVQIPATGAKSLVPRSTTDGWSYDDEANPTSVILNGAACSSFTNAGAQGTKIKVVIGCPSKVN